MPSTRTILKLMIHHALDVIDRVKEMSADALEQYHDLLSEVEAERSAAKRRKAQAEASGNDAGSPRIVPVDGGDCD